jgi:hypothetical protein
VLNVVTVRCVDEIGAVPVDVVGELVATTGTGTFVERHVHGAKSGALGAGSGTSARFTQN